MGLASNFLYVLSNVASVGTITQYLRNKITGDLTEVTPAITYTQGYLEDKIIVDAQGKFAYVVSTYMQYDGTYYNRIFQYLINQITGALTLITGGINPIKTSCSCFGICDDGKGKFLYTACAYGYDGNFPSILCKYTINPITGQLTELGTPTVLTHTPYGMCNTILGKYLYISHSAPNEVSTYEINQTTGDITEVGTHVVLSGNCRYLYDDGTGKYLYTASWGGRVIDEFSINQSDGLITNIGSFVVDSYHVTNDGTGKFIYSSPSSSALINKMLIGPTGTLTTIGITFTEAGSYNNPMANSGDGKFLYTICGNTDPGVLLGFSIDGVSGELTPLSTPFVAPGNSIAICSSRSNSTNDSSVLGYQFSTYPSSPVFDVLSYKDTEVLTDTVTVNPDILEPTDNLVISTPKVSTAPETTEKQRITDTVEKLNNFLAAAKEMQVVLDEKLQDYVVKVDVNKNPHVRDAIRRLFGVDSNVITYDMFKKALEMRSQYLKEQRDQSFT